jgi:hypothetical protein
VKAVVVVVVVVMIVAVAVVVAAVAMTMAVMAAANMGNEEGVQNCGNAMPCGASCCVGMQGHGGSRERKMKERAGGKANRHTRCYGGGFTSESALSSDLLLFLHQGPVDQKPTDQAQASAPVSQVNCRVQS